MPRGVLLVEQRDHLFDSGRPCENTKSILSSCHRQAVLVLSSQFASNSSLVRRSHQQGGELGKWTSVVLLVLALLDSQARTCILPSRVAEVDRDNRATPHGCGELGVVFWVACYPSWKTSFPSYTCTQTWRRGRDSNPRYRVCPYTRFPGVHLRPLGHLSAKSAQA